MQVVAIDPPAAFRTALRMWLPRTGVAVDNFHLVSLASQAMTDARQNLSHQVKGCRGGASTRPGSTGPRSSGRRYTDRRAAHLLAQVFTADHAVWKVKEPLRLLLRTNSLADAADAKEDHQTPVEAAGRPETNKLNRTVSRWRKEIVVLIATGVTPAKVEANNTDIKYIERIARGYRNTGNYKSIIRLSWLVGGPIIHMRSAVRTAA